MCQCDIRPEEGEGSKHDAGEILVVVRLFLATGGVRLIISLTIHGQPATEDLNAKNSKVNMRVTGPEILTGTGTKAGTINMTGPGLGLRPGP